jgi:hypothetical protein
MRAKAQIRNSKRQAINLVLKIKVCGGSKKLIFLIKSIYFYFPKFWEAMQTGYFWSILEDNQLLPCGHGEDTGGRMRVPSIVCATVFLTHIWVGPPHVHLCRPLGHLFMYFSPIGPNRTTLSVWVEAQKLPSWEIYLT